MRFQYTIMQTEKIVGVNNDFLVQAFILQSMRNLFSFGET